MSEVKGKQLQVMTGAADGSAGSKGAAPAPVAGDNRKVLFGDATYRDPSEGILYPFVIRVFEETTALVTGDGKGGGWIVPEGMDGKLLVNARLKLDTSGTGSTTVQIRRIRPGSSTEDLLTTKLTVDTAETDSEDSGSPVAIDPFFHLLANKDVLFFDFDSVATGALGATVIVEIQSAALFDPLTVTSMVLWLDGQDDSKIALGTGADVGSWTDKKNGVFFLNGTVARRPALTAEAINGHQALFFDGTDDVLQAQPGTDVLTSTAGTCLMVLRPTSTSVVNRGILSKANNALGNSHFFVAAGTVSGGTLKSPGVYEDAGVGLKINGDSVHAIDLNDHIYVISTNGTIHRGDQDSTSRTNMTNIFGGGAGRWFGDWPGTFIDYNVGAGRGSTIKFPFQGYIGEIMLFSSDLSAGDISDVFNYLKAKWGTP